MASYHRERRTHYRPAGIHTRLTKAFLIPANGIGIGGVQVRSLDYSCRVGCRTELDPREGGGPALICLLPDRPTG